LTAHIAVNPPSPTYDASAGLNPVEQALELLAVRGRQQLVLHPMDVALGRGDTRSRGG
jgi:hypothetical protein